MSALELPARAHDRVAGRYVPDGLKGNSEECGGDRGLLRRASFCMLGADVTTPWWWNAGFGFEFLHSVGPHGRLLVLSARPGEQPLLDDDQISQSKQSM